MLILMSIVKSGEDDQAIPAILKSGTVGVISVTANVAPSLVQKACDFALKKMVSRAVC